jgi:hypothetical protein
VIFDLLVSQKFLKHEMNGCFPSILGSPDKPRALGRPPKKGVPVKLKERFSSRAADSQTAIVPLYGKGDCCNKSLCAFQTGPQGYFAAICVRLPMPWCPRLLLPLSAFAFPCRGVRGYCCRLFTQIYFFACLFRTLTYP